jgi:hypothetical protein
MTKNKIQPGTGRHEERADKEWKTKDWLRGGRGPESSGFRIQEEKQVTYVCYQLNTYFIIQ